MRGKIFWLKEENTGFALPHLSTRGHCQLASALLYCESILQKNATISVIKWHFTKKCYNCCDNMSTVSLPEILSLFGVLSSFFFFLILKVHPKFLREICTYNKSWWRVFCDWKSNKMLVKISSCSFRIELLSRKWIIKALLSSVHIWGDFNQQCFEVVPWLWFRFVFDFWLRKTAC